MQDPRIGLVFLRAGWLNQADNPPLTAILAEDVDHIRESFQNGLDLEQVWIVDSYEALQACQAGVRDSNLDLIVLAYQTSADERLLAGLLDGLGDLPLVVWCYLPWRRLPRRVTSEELLRGSGPSAMLAALGTLQKRRTHFVFIHGAPESPRLLNDLRLAARAARARRLLRSARIGLLAGSSAVEAARFTREVGPKLVRLPVDQYRASVDKARAQALEKAMARLESIARAPMVSIEMLDRAAGAALGLAQLAGEQDLDALAVDPDDPELLSAVGVSLGLHPASLVASGVLFQSWPDPCAAAAGLVLSWLADEPVFSMRVWFWDDARNQVIGGSSGLQDPRVAGNGSFTIGLGMSLAPQEGVPMIQPHFIARPGRVTLFQIRPVEGGSFPTGGFAASVATGVCLESLEWAEACPHAVLRLDPQIDHFLTRLAATGASPNWVMVYGSLVPELDAFCQIAGISLDIIM